MTAVTVMCVCRRTLLSLSVARRMQEGGPYEGGMFKARLDFPDDFPNQPPVLTFVTPIFHPNGKCVLWERVQVVAALMCSGELC